MVDDPFALLREAGAACREAGVAYAVIGAVARNAWASPRATADLDLAALIANRAVCDRLVAGLSNRGVVVVQLAGGEGDEPPDLLRLEQPAGTVRRLDIVVAKTPFEREAVTTALPFHLGETHPVVGPEHLVVYKLIAGRPHDLEDAVEVIRTRALDGHPIDDGFVRRWAAEWEVLDRLEDVLRRSAPA
ncbi:MAG TPA: hypothetical protein VGR62_03280 [Candidatus Binatia bacterium]|jgi:hypothetical protein|nr:hypothetical protein [Candidatus Binatia bacterium]